MPATTTLYPYEFSWDLQIRPYDPFDPTQEDLDLSWIERASEDGEFQQLDLAGSSIAWRQLVIQLRADLPEAELERILSDSSNPESDTALLVSVRCASTKYRRVVRLEAAGRASWSGSVRVRRSDVRSVVELHPLLVRTTRIPSDEISRKGIAVERGATIGQGRSVRLLVDKTERSIKGAPKIVWEDFRASGDPWRKAHSSDLFCFEPEGQEPTLWLNASYPQLRELLHSREEKGVDAALRHMANALLAQVVWAQIFMTAVGGIEIDDELGTLEIPGGWKQDVLSALLSRVLPDAPKEVDRYRELAEMFKSPDQVGTLVTKLGSAIQDIVGTGRLFQNAVRAAETVGEE